MKLETKTGFVHMSNDFQKKEFKIEASAQAFHVLSAQLYSNKIRAIIRELSCNAIDAMRASGKIDTHKFIVNLPNALTPEFRIRDFGTGISPEDIDQIYTTYFSSTKRDSNDQIGCLGLGSKTPYCYTDNFQVNSYFNGIKYSYTAVIDEEQMPQIIKMSETATLEENGMEILFAVKPRDFNSFENEAFNTFIWFTHRPKLLGTHLSIPEYGWKQQIFVSKQIDNWKWQIVTLGGDNRYNALIGPHVVMGGVAYKLNPNDFENAPPEVLAILNMNIHIFVEIGEVKPAANRETLHLDNKSKASIKNKLMQISKDFGTVLAGKIDDCKNYWEALHFWSEKERSFDYFIRDYLNKSGYKPSYKGRVLESTLAFPWGATAAFSRNSQRGPNDWPQQKELCHSFQPSIGGNAVFVWRPPGSDISEINAINYYKKYTKDSHDSFARDYRIRDRVTVFYLDADLLKKSDGTTFTFDEAKAYIDGHTKNFINLADFPDCASKVPEAEEEEAKERRVKKKDEAYPVTSRSIYSSDAKTVTSELEVVDLVNGECYYVASHFRKPLNSNGEEVSPFVLAQMIKACENITKTTLKVYALTKTQIESLEKNTKWKEFFSTFRFESNKILKSAAYKKYVTRKVANNHYDLDFPGNEIIRSWPPRFCGNTPTISASTTFIEFVKKLPKNHEIAEIHQKISDWKADKALTETEYVWLEKLNSTLTLYQDKGEYETFWAEIKAEVSASGEKLSKEASEIWKKYPLMEMLFPCGKSPLAINEIVDVLIKSV
jgi:hypothetical protein